MYLKSKRNFDLKAKEISRIIINYYVIYNF